MSALARARFPTAVTLFGYTLSIGMELAVVAAIAEVFFVLAFRDRCRHHRRSHRHQRG